MSASPETILEKASGIIDAELDELKRARETRQLTEDEHRRVALYMRAVSQTAKIRRSDAEDLDDEELLERMRKDPLLLDALTGGR